MQAEVITLNIKKVEELITSQGLKQCWLAGQLGVKEPCFSWWMTGRSKPTVAQLHNLAALLGVAVSEIGDNGQEENIEVREG